MPKKGFTLLEILVVLFIVGALTIFSVGGLHRARKAHQLDCALQELVLLRTAILSYKERYGSFLTKSWKGDLSSNAFDKLKPFWYPFRPENSKAVKNGRWYGEFDDKSFFLTLKSGSVYVKFDDDLLEKKIKGFCAYENADDGTKENVNDGTKENVNDGTKFYILKQTQTEQSKSSQ